MFINEADSTEKESDAGEEPLRWQDTYEPSFTDSDYNSDALRELQILLPEVMQELKRNGHDETFLKFCKLLAFEEFPTNNICFLLFTDLVELLYNTETCQMRYNDISIKFWQMGYRIFGGKFLRFMSGPKCQGTILEGTEQRGSQDSKSAKINFAIPARQNLFRSEEKCAKILPGIVTDFVNLIALKSFGKSYKLCVDGKKISRGRGKLMGDIDCWGYEKKPSLAMKKERFSREDSLIKEMNDFVQSLISHDLKSLLDSEKINLSANLKSLIAIISERIKDLRTSKLSLERSITKFKAMAGEDWRKSRFQIVISLLITTKYDTENYISEALQINLQLGYYLSTLHDVQHLYSLDSRVHLSDQGNYFELKSDLETNDSRFVKQKSDQWFQLRNRAQVTGSTVYRALGLDSLKAQQQHFDKVIHGREIPNPSKSQLEAMQYGIDHEIDAISTVASRFLPAYYPQLNYIEEGCQVTTKNNVTMVTSPDGSFREMCSSSPKLMYENKCRPPLPNRCSVYYDLPRYYVLQVLGEMMSYDCSELIFSCYSPESTVIMHVTKDIELWDLMWEELNTVYDKGNERRPTRFSENTKIMKSKIPQFIQNNVKLVAEFPSTTAQMPNHQNEDDKASPFFIPKERSNSEMIQTDRVVCLLRKAREWLKNVYEISRDLATEVLVFMLSDLDRHYSMEIPSSFPIAYAMKGPSMPTCNMKDMMEQVIMTCEEHNVSVVATASDGQWHNYGVFNNDDKPLTMLQLQRFLWKEVKALTKAELTAWLKKLCYVDSKNIKDYVIVQQNETTRALLVSHRHNHFSLKVNSSVLKSFILPKYNKPKSIDNQEKVNHCDVQGEQISINELQDVELCDPSTLLEIENMFHQYSQPVNVEENLLSEETIMDFDMLFQSEHDTQLELGSEVEVGQDIYNTENLLLDISNLHVASTENTLQANRSSCLTETDCIQIQSHLSKDPKSCKSHSWSDMELVKVQAFFKNAETISKLTRQELIVIVRALKNKLIDAGYNCKLSWPKHKIVNLVASAFGSHTEVEPKQIKRCNTPSLKSLCFQYIKKLSKDDLCILKAENTWNQTVEEWYADSPIKNCIPIGNLSNDIVWATKPRKGGDGKYRFHFTDYSHILTCLRQKVCTSGIKGLSKQAWIQAALSKTTVLNISIVVDCIDKQSVAFAKRLFGEDVERFMNDNNFKEEAKFCRLIRRWYEAEDERGLEANDRCKRRLDLRNWLLDGVDFSRFPPLTQYIKGIPVVTYEGLLCHTERTIQLYSFCANNCYNSRSLGTQEVEQFFGTFRDLDPHGLGTPKPDDIPEMMTITMEINEQRLNPDR